jgi:hypothetical protein
MSRSFIRVTVNLKIELIEDRTAVKQYEKKFLLVAPDRKLIAELVQEATVETAANKLMEMFDEINESHTTLAETNQD